LWRPLRDSPISAFEHKQEIAMSESTQIRRTDSDGVITLTFTRDEKMNAVSPEMLDVMRATVADFAEKDEHRVLVFTAEGRFFTAGIDIGRLNDGESHQTSSGVNLRRDYRRLHLLFDELEAIEKPVIHAAQGPCFGVGVELSASCDFRLAAARATYALPEIINLAVIAGSGGVSRVTRLVGPHWARWIAMAPQTVDAQKAMIMGLVHEVYPDESFAGEVQKFACSLAALSREALGLAKLAIDAAASSDRVTARNFDRVANSLLINSDEHRAKIEAFMARSQRKK
jgi:enoyl-CoA hydratase/carnithine racemase